MARGINQPKPEQTFSNGSFPGPAVQPGKVPPKQWIGGGIGQNVSDGVNNRLAAKSCNRTLPARSNPDVFIRLPRWFRGDSPANGTGYTSLFNLAASTVPSGIFMKADFALLIV